MKNKGNRRGNARRKQGPSRQANALPAPDQRPAESNFALPRDTKISPGAQEQLRLAAEAIRRREPAFVRRVFPAGFGMIAAGEAGEDAMAAGNSYLPSNRFDWWDWWLDSTRHDDFRLVSNPLEFQGPNPADALTAEFCSPFAVVVGSDLDAIDRVFPPSKIRWDDSAIPDDASPNVVPNLPFVVTGGPNTQQLNLVPLLLGDVPTRVLSYFEDRTAEGQPGESRLFIDFLMPLRAVALEYGFKNTGRQSGDDLQTLEDPMSEVQLYAYDRDHNVVATSDGSKNIPPTQPVIKEDELDNVIGARAIDFSNAEAGITRIELRLTSSSPPGGAPPFVPAILVHRIWLDSWPPAAVQQGTHVFNSIEEVAPVQLTMPFRCNRAAVFVRGFKLMFLDKQAHRIKRLGAGINGASVFQTERGGTIRFSATGVLATELAVDPPFQVLVYYTAVAWDDDQMDLLTASGAAGESSSGAPGGVQGDNPSHLRMELADPSESSTDSVAATGKLFGGLQEFSLAVADAQRVDHLWLAVGMAGGGECHIGPPNKRPEDVFLDVLGAIFTLGITLLFDTRLSQFNVRTPDLFRGGGDLHWDFCTLLKGEDQHYRRHFAGTVLTGPAVQLPDRNSAFSLSGVGQRASPDAWLATFIDDPNDATIRNAWPIEGDIAFLAFEMLYVEPQWRLRELEVEFKGKNYDGKKVDWQIAGGLARKGAGAGGDNQHLFLAIPTFGALTRRTALPPDFRLGVQSLVFRAATVGTVDQVPIQFGMLRNDGPAPVIVSHATLGGPNPEFAVWFQLRNQQLSPNDLLTGPPLWLESGEAIVITGFFFPQADAPDGTPPRTAWIDFTTSAANMRTVRVMMQGNTAAGQAEGALTPTVVIFGQVELVPAGDVPFSSDRNALITSVGQSPLLVNFQLADDNLGFRIRGTEGGNGSILFNGVNSIQINSGGFLIIHLEFIPVAEGPVQTQLLVTTNDADPTNRNLSARLTAMGIP